MADPEHLEILKRGVKEWNDWRTRQPRIGPDLSHATLDDQILFRINFGAAVWKGEENHGSYTVTAAYILPTSLEYASLRHAHLDHSKFGNVCLRKADLEGATLRDVDLSYANLQGANLREVHLDDSDLSHADLTDANLRGAFMDNADFTNTNLTSADLRDVRAERARFVKTNLRRANLTGARMYGISAWDVDTTDAIQNDIIITSYYTSSFPSFGGTVTVDDLEVAQFVYLLLNNSKLRNVIDTVARRAVLILGRFTPERKEVLECVREELRARGFLPILFDFTPSEARNLTESISTLAHLSRFVIADITDARSVPQELQRIVPNLPSLPVAPLLQHGADEYGMFADYRDYPWVLDVYRYRNVIDLRSAIGDAVIEPAVRKADEIQRRRHDRSSQG